MKTWRERIVEARARGRFTRDDQLAWMDTMTCPGAEVASRYCANVETIMDGPWWELWRMGGMMNGFIYEQPDPDGAERLLDSIEDKALQLKREATP